MRLRFASALLVFLLISPMWAAEQAEPAAGTAKDLDLPGGGKISMVYVPAGDFLMGNTGKEPETNDRELPQHSVKLSGYWIGKFEVTRGQYKSFMDAKGYDTRSYWSEEGWKWKTDKKRAQPDNWDAMQKWWTPPGVFTQTDKHPVIGVTYYEAEAFCKWAGLRLPTEAEWEKAARWDGHPRIYPWGDSWDAEKCKNSDDTLYAGQQTAPAGSYAAGASPFGCMDMAGNVWEWCSDRFSDKYYSQAPKDGWVDPKGPAEGEMHVIRGGGWGSKSLGLRCATRSCSKPDLGYFSIGLRVAK